MEDNRRFAIHMFDSHSSVFFLHTIGPHAFIDSKRIALRRPTLRTREETAYVTLVPTTNGRFAQENKAIRGPFSFDSEKQNVVT